MTNGVSKMSDGRRLSDLGLEVGDVVESVSGYSCFFNGGNRYTILEGQQIQDDNGSICQFRTIPHVFRVISRAKDVFKKWRDMSDTRKGEILLAWHDGKDVEISRNEGLDWIRVENDGSKAFMFDSLYYRIAEPKPVVATEEFYATEKLKGFGHDKGVNSKYKLTFATTNGVPDCDTVKMEVVA